MFAVGDKLVYKSSAVCIVESIETPAFVKEKDRLYYKLRHLFSGNGEVVYVPTDSNVSLRPVMDEDGAGECLEYLKNAEPEPFTVHQPVLINNHYQKILSDGRIESSLLVLKEILVKQKTLGKLRQAEGHFLSVVERAVCEELAVALSKETFEIMEIINETVFGE